MSRGDMTVTVVGNLGGDPELRVTPNGAAIATFSVGVTPRQYDKAAGRWTDGETSWVRCVAWRDLAEHVAESLSKGDRVIVVGVFAEEHWTDRRSGDKRSTWKLTADAVGPDLLWIDATLKRTTRTTSATVADDQWASAAQSADEPPF